MTYPFYFDRKTKHSLSVVSAQQPPLLEEVADGAPEVNVGLQKGNQFLAGGPGRPEGGTHLLNVDPEDVVDGGAAAKAAVPAAPALDAVLAIAAVPTG